MVCCDDEHDDDYDLDNVTDANVDDDVLDVDRVGIVDVVDVVAVVDDVDAVAKADEVDDIDVGYVVVGLVNNVHSITYMLLWCGSLSAVMQRLRSDNVDDSAPHGLQ